jgi:hypothetical protein
LSLGVQLSPKLQALLPQMAEQIVSFLKEMSVPVVSIDAPAGPYA